MGQNSSQNQFQRQSAPQRTVSLQQSAPQRTVPQVKAEYKDANVMFRLQKVNN